MVAASKYHQHHYYLCYVMDCKKNFSANKCVINSFIVVSICSCPLSTTLSRFLIKTLK